MNTKTKEVMVVRRIILLLFTVRSVLSYNVVFSTDVPMPLCNSSRMGGISQLRQVYRGVWNN